MIVKGLTPYLNDNARTFDMSKYNILYGTNYISKPSEICIRSFFYFFFDGDEMDHESQIEAYEHLKRKLQNYRLTPNNMKSPYDKIDEKDLENKFINAKNNYDSHMKDIDEYYELLDNYDENIKCIKNELKDNDIYLLLLNSLLLAHIPFSEYPKTIINILGLSEGKLNPSYIDKNNVISFLEQDIDHSEYIDTSDLKCTFIAIERNKEAKYYDQNNNNIITKEIMLDGINYDIVKLDNCIKKIYICIS